MSLFEWWLPGEEAYLTGGGGQGGGGGASGAWKPVSDNSGSRWIPTHEIAQSFPDFSLPEGQGERVEFYRDEQERIILKYRTLYECDYISVGFNNLPIDAPEYDSQGFLGFPKNDSQGNLLPLYWKTSFTYYNNGEIMTATYTTPDGQPIAVGNVYARQWQSTYRDKLSISTPYAYPYGYTLNNQSYRYIGATAKTKQSLPVMVERRIEPEPTIWANYPPRRAEKWHYTIETWHYAFFQYTFSALPTYEEMAASGSIVTALLIMALPLLLGGKDITIRSLEDDSKRVNQEDTP